VLGSTIELLSVVMTILSFESGPKLENMLPSLDILGDSLGDAYFLAM